MKKIVATALVALILLFAVGCGTSDTSTETTAQETTVAETTVETTAIEEPSAQETTVETTEAVVIEPSSTDEILTELLPSALPDGVEWDNGSLTSRPVASTATQDNTIAYVLIYNPYIYNENLQSNPSLYTGNFSSQVEVSMNRADELEVPLEHTPISVAEINRDFPLDKADLSGNRADIMLTPYTTGQKRNFYTSTGSSQSVLKNFTCLYTGTYCNVWVSSDATLSADNAKFYANEFDSKIYNNCVNLFGTPRFSQNGGKVNLLFTPMEQGLLGFARIADIFATGEFSEADVTAYGMNLNHAIIHLSANYANDRDSITRTLAHELQHQIVFSGAFENPNMLYPNTWINEAMSAYIEDYLYPGSKLGYIDVYNTSISTRHGQSLYNFTTHQSFFSSDIGPYGSVYLYSSYVKKWGYYDAFTRFHKYYRSFNYNLNDATGLKNTFSLYIQDAVNNIADFSSLGFANKDEEWLSKFTLRFYLDMLVYDYADPIEFQYVNPNKLVYDQLSPANIEGGGRIIVAVKNGTYNVPADASKGLVYVGLNKNFVPVTNCLIF